MHGDLSSRFVHDTVVHGNMEIFEGGHNGDEIGGISFVVQRRAVEGGRKNIVNAGGGSIGKDRCEGPGVVALDDFLGSGKEDLARDGSGGVIDLITLGRIRHDDIRSELLLPKVFRS